MRSSSVAVNERPPRVRHVPAAADLADGEDAVELAAGYGLLADPWQADVVVSWLSRDAAGRMACGRCGLAVPRQNGKNGVLEIVELYKMAILGRRILHTAHEVKTARKAFVRLASFFENKRKYPELAAKLKEIRRTNGQEAIFLTNGGSIEFVARSRGSGRGFTVDDLVLDEAQEMSDEQLDALLPTISAAPSGDPQMFFTGTPPGPNSPGEVFTRTRDAGVKGSDKRLVWHEWSIPDTGKVKLNDPKVWAATNPALGIRLNRSVIEDEFKAMSPDGFARERLGRWPVATSATKPTIDQKAWKNLKIDTAPTGGRVAFGIKFSVDGNHLALAAARRPDVGPVHLEGLEVRPVSAGFGWLVTWLIDRKDTTTVVTIDGRAGTAGLVQALRAGRQGPTGRIEKLTDRMISVPNTDQAIAAHTMLLNAVHDLGLSHVGQPGLDAAVGEAIKRPIGTSGGFGWQPRSENGSVLILDAATLAFHGVMTSRRRPGRKTTGGVL